MNIILIITLFIATITITSAQKNNNNVNHQYNLILKDNDEPNINVVGVQGVVDWATKRTAAGAADFQASGLTRQSSPDFWGDGIVYQIVVDRFNNGDVSNDDLNLPPDQIAYRNSSNLYNLNNYRHGGDIQGIIDRLDYLADLGVNTLWITPVFKHTGDYHGYCTTDLTFIDPGFGTNELYRELVNQAHSRGMYVVQDIVVNHLCDRQSNYSTPPSDHETCASDLNTMYWKGVAGESSAQGEIAFSSSFFPPLSSTYFFSRCGPNSQQDTSGEGPAAVFGDFVNGMYDYDTRNYDFQNIFTELHKFWIAYADIDGLRMDAAKHITEDFIAYFATNIRDYARTLGKDNFFVIGEVAASADWEGRRLGNMFSNPENPNQHGVVPVSLTSRLLTLKDMYLANPQASYPGLTAVYDFAGSGTARDTLLGHRSSSDLATYYNSDGYHTLAGNNNYMYSWILVEIHDWPRFLHDDSNDWSKMVAALTWLLTAPGQPIIEYGAEQGFNGRCGSLDASVGQAASQITQVCNDDDDACYRQDMFFASPWRLQSAIPDINFFSYIGQWVNAVSPPWQQDVMLQRNHSLYQHARKMTHIRQSCSPLRRGQLVWRDAQPRAGGLLVFSRVVAGSPGEEILILINPGLNEINLDRFQIDSTINSVSGQTYVNLFDTSQTATTSIADNISYLNFNNNLSISNDQVQIWVHQNNVAPYNQYLQVSLCLR